MLQSQDGHSPYTGTKQFVPTTKRIAQFSEGHEPKPGDKIVYVAGAFDLFRILDFMFQTCTSTYLYDMIWFDLITLKCDVHVMYINAL